MTHAFDYGWVEVIEGGIHSVKTRRHNEDFIYRFQRADYRDIDRSKHEQTQYRQEQIPDAMIEAAKVDGASLMRICWGIVMPNSKPALMTIIIFQFQAAWNSNGGCSREICTLRG